MFVDVMEIDHRETDRVARGRELVSAELVQRGAARVEAPRNGLWETLLAYGRGSHALPIRVKTTTCGAWDATVSDGRLASDAGGDTSFWVLVDLSPESETPSFYVMPEWWIRDHIYETYCARLVAHAAEGTALTDAEQTIDRECVDRWLDRWDVIERLLA